MNVNEMRSSKIGGRGTGKPMGWVLKAPKSPTDRSGTHYLGVFDSRRALTRFLNLILPSTVGVPCLTCAKNDA